MTQGTDLTRGKVSSVLLAFYFPMLAGNALQQAYTFADTVIVGRGLGDGALGSVGNLSAMMLLINGFLMGITNGFGVHMAQRFGAGDLPALRRSVVQAIRLLSLITAGLTAASLLMMKQALLFIHTDGALMRDCLVYGNILFGGLFVTTASHLCTCLLRAMGDGRTPLVAVTVSSAVNILLDCLLIFGFHTGVGGAAAATVTAQGVSVWICAKRLGRMLPLHREDLARDPAQGRMLLANGLPAALMNSITAVGCLMVQRFVNGPGAVYTSAYSACSKLLNLMMLPGITAGFALSAFIGQNKGAGRFRRIRQGMRVGIGIAMAAWLVPGGIVFLFPEMAAAWLLSGREAIRLAGGYLRICGGSLLLLNLLFLFRHGVQGLGHPIPPMLSGLVEMGLRLAVVLLWLPGMGFQAAAHAEWIAWLGALLFNGAAYRLLMGRAQP